ncbi:MAG: hypothetical protein Q9201_000341 [Fulgogasparrea decipioides]
MSFDTAHPTKRRFQTNITSYLSQISTPTPHHTEKPAGLAPELPPAIQSSLLNVGMRIRKSVPEGYKTKQAGCVLRTNVDDCAVFRGGNSEDAELVPYCGMNKTGSQEVQPRADVRVAYDSLDPEVEDEAEEFPTSGQELVLEDESAVGTGAGSFQACKRRFVDEEEEEIVGNDVEEVKGVRSHCTTDISSSMALRPIAQARNRRSVAAHHKVIDDGDFGEATFLRNLDESMDIGE